MWQYSAAPGKLYPYAVLGTVKLKSTKGTNAVSLPLHCNAASILFQ